MNRHAAHLTLEHAGDVASEEGRRFHFRESLKMTLMSAGVAILLLGCFVALAAARGGP